MNKTKRKAAVHSTRAMSLYEAARYVRRAIHYLDDDPEKVSLRRIVWTLDRKRLAYMRTRK